MTIVFRGGNPHGIELVIFLKNYFGIVNIYNISFVDIILAGGEVVPGVVPSGTEAAGSLGEPLLKWRRRYYSRNY